MKTEKQILEEYKDRILNGGQLTEEEIYALVDFKDKEAIRRVAGEITRA